MADGRLTKLDFLPDVDFDEILTNPILDIAARFWDKNRYEAFRICYRSMRLIDDLVDHRKSESREMTVREKTQLKNAMHTWVQAMKDGDTSDDFRHELTGIIRTYRIPFWPWERLYKSMVYDLDNNGFTSIISFLRYSEGAAIAPASIFMHLCGVRKIHGEYVEPEFDIRLAARPLAQFSYFVHIIRDFQKDHKSNLNYFADDKLRKYNLSVEMLHDAACGAPIPNSFRHLIAEYKKIADYYRTRARVVLDSILPSMKPRYQLSLEMIYSLYLQIFERIDSENGNFSESELNPSSEEIKARIDRTISNFPPDGY